MQFRIFFNVELLFHAEELCQIGWRRSFRYQQYQSIQPPGYRREATLQVGEEVLLWTSAQQRGRNKKVAKILIGPYVEVRLVA